MAKFEIVSKYAAAGLALPRRKTQYSAGYDLAVAQDIVIPSVLSMQNCLTDFAQDGAVKLSTIADLTKITQQRPVLVSTGLKCKLDKGTYLEVTLRSSTPLKYWLIMANAEGIIDSDYYNNPSNEGEIFFQLINLSPIPIQLKKGDVIGQGIIKSYLTTEDDTATGKRVGGLGSTSPEASLRPE